MSKISIDLTVTFTTPPSVGAAGATHTLADKVVTRNARGDFVIPASQVKGKLRHACEQILRSQAVVLCYPPRPDRMCPQLETDDEGREIPQAEGQPRCTLCRVFGSPARPSRLRFLDLVVEKSALLPTETLRQMVSLNRVRRTAQENRLFLVETAPHVSGLTFTRDNAITGRLDSEAELHLLLVGLKALFAWGGATSRGLGWGSVLFKATFDGRVIGTIRKAEVELLYRS